MKRLIFFLLLFAAIKVAGQTTGYLRFDTVKIMKQNGTCELYIINKTKDTLGILTNVGGGLTQFRKSRVLNDSTIVVGLDTLMIIGGAGGGGGAGSVTSISQGYGIVATPNPITSTGSLRVDTLNITTKASRDKLKDSLQANINLKVNISDTATMLANYIRDANDGLQKTGQVVSIANNGVTTAKIADNNVTNAKIVAFSPFPAQRTYGKIYEKSLWNNVSEDLQVNTAANNTLALSTGLIDMSVTGFNSQNVTTIIPHRISCLNKSKITAWYQLTTVSATTSEIGLEIRSVITHSGANFGYMGFVQTTSSGTGSLFIYDQGRSSQKATTTGFTFAANDIIECILDLRDTTLVFSVQNLTSDPTGVNKKTATYNFTPNSSAHILPNSYNWALYDGNSGSGARRLRYIKIESDDTQYPNLLVLGNSKTKIGYATFWNGRFGMQLNNTYPNTVINAGGAERLSDMILRLDEITQLSPSQVLLADIASNSLRGGISFADVVTQYKYIVSRLEGAGIRVLHCVLPEDSTAGGLGQTAWVAWLASEYASTYINEVYDDMSTNNIADAGMVHADGIHLVQAGNNQATSSLIASGDIQVISTQRRSEIRTGDGWIVKTGDSIHLSKKIFSKHNYVPRWDFNNQSLTTGVQFMDSTKSIFSMSSRPASPLSNALVAVDGPIATYGVTGGRYMYDRTTPANNYAEYINLNTFYLNYNGTDRQSIGTEGQQSWGNSTLMSTTLIPSTIHINRDYTLASMFARKGFSFSSDSITITHSGSTALGDRSINSYHKARMTASGSTSYDTLATVLIEGAPYTVGGDNVAINFPLALEVLFGRTHLGQGVSILNSPSAYGAYKLATINPDSTLGTVASSTFATQSALNDTAAAIRAYVSTGTYTPTLTNGSNVDASTLQGTAYYQRIGNFVTVWGHIEIDPTASSTLTIIGVSLPVASSLAQFHQLSGHAVANGAGGYLSAFIAGDATNDRAQIEFTSGGTAAAVYSFRFSYEVL